MSFCSVSSLASGVCSVSWRVFYLVRSMLNARFMFTFPILKQLVQS